MTDAIYQRQELLDIYKHPSNFGTLTDATVAVTQANPMCGDTVILYLKLTKDRITNAMFSGSSCAVGVISASLFTEFIIGKTLTEARAITKADVLALMQVELTTSRVKCALLIYEAFEKALQTYDSTKIKA